MAIFEVGEYIKKTRKQMGITQEELAKPYMDRSHISKIERGLVTPDYGTLKIILERLGITQEHFLKDIFISKSDAFFQEKFNMLDGFIFSEQWDDAEKAFKDLTSRPESANKPLYRQRILLFEGIFMLRKSDTWDIAYTKFIEAIQISLPLFDETNISKYLLTKTDILVINNIALYYEKKENRKQAVEILYQLKQNLDEHFVDIHMKGASYPLILMNLVFSLEELKRFEEAIELCQIGHQICLTLGRSDMLPGLVAVKASCLHELGDKEIAKKFFKQAYYGFDLLGRFSERDRIQHYTTEIGLDLML